MTTRRDAVDAAIVDALIASGDWRSVIVHERDRHAWDACAEVCAKACEERFSTEPNDAFRLGFNATTTRCAAACRALKSDASKQEKL